MGDITVRELCYWGRLISIVGVIVGAAALITGAVSPAIIPQAFGYHCVTSAHLLVCAH